MKQLLLSLAFVPMFADLSAEEAKQPEAPYQFEMGFETPVKRGYAPNTKNKIFVAPSKEISFDDSGAKAHSGKGAIALKQGESLTMDVFNLQSGKTYTMTAWVRAEQPGVKAAIRFVWFTGSKAFKVDNRTLAPADAEWTKLSQTVKAPEGFTHAYFVFDGGSKDVPVWFDDFSVTEE